jgi:hypothetical protein
MKNLFFLLITIFSVSTALKAQTHFNLAFQVGVPIGEFRENTEAVGAGFKAGLFVPFADNIPVYFGLDFGYMVYGANTQFVNENLQVTASNGAVLGSIPINLRVQTNNNLINGHAVLRLKAPLANVQPYVDGLIGLNYLYTRTKILDETRNGVFSQRDPQTGQVTSNVINAQTQEQSVVLSYGGAFGLQIKLSENFRLDARGVYLIGGKARYYDRSQTSLWSVGFSGSNFNPTNPNPDDLDLITPDAVSKQSTTDMFIGTLGITLSF